VAVERIYVELTKLLLGKGVGRILTEFKEVFFHLIPKLKLCDGFEQKSKFHCYDVYAHIVKSIENSAPDKIVRWALLLHDIEKPACFTVDDNIRFLKELTQHPQNSLFDHPYLAMMKRLHELFMTARFP
jgi:tRNA nucleotidyltransferase (CCA-adding enzyme)